MTNKLMGTLGMTEMELAAAKIVEKGMDSPIYLEDMTTDQERTGLIELVFCGWMKKGVDPWCYNGGFVATDALKDRLRDVGNRNLP